MGVTRSGLLSCSENLSTVSVHCLVEQAQISRVSKCMFPQFPIYEVSAEWDTASCVQLANSRMGE